MAARGARGVVAVMPPKVQSAPKSATPGFRRKARPGAKLDESDPFCPVGLPMAGATKIPPHLRYTEDHEWVLLEGDRVRIGITDYAQEALTEVVFVELPDEGEAFAHHDSLGVVESVKSVNDIFAPVAGRVVEVNAALDDSPELMNEDPYGKGWFCVLEMTSPADVSKLMDAAAYEKFIQSH